MDRRIKYTQEDREEIVRMYEEGKLLSEIGAKYGASKQSISQLLSRMGVQKRNKKKGHACSMAYPGLARYLKDNKLRPVDIGRMIGYKNPSSSMGAILSGRFSFSQKTIEKLMAVTGLTYEQMIGKVEYNDKPKIELGDDFFSAVLNCAIRYCIGRVSYMPSLVCDYIRPLLPYLSEKTLWCMEKDIEGADSYGMPQDKEMWKGFLKAVKEAKKNG